MLFLLGHFLRRVTWSRPVPWARGEIVSYFVSNIFVLRILTFSNSVTLISIGSAPPNSLLIGGAGGGGAHRKRRTLVAPDMNLSLDQSEGSLISDDFLETPDDLDINVDDIETPDESDSLEFITNGNDLEWEGKGCATSLFDLNSV